MIRRYLPPVLAGALLLSVASSMTLEADLPSVAQVLTIISASAPLLTVLTGTTSAAVRLSTKLARRGFRLLRRGLRALR